MHVHEDESEGWIKAAMFTPRSAVRRADAATSPAPPIGRQSNRISAGILKYPLISWRQAESSACNSGDKTRIKRRCLVKYHIMET